MLHNAWELARAAVGLDHLHFHDLRHSGNTWAETSDVALDASFDTLCDRCPIRLLGSEPLDAAS
jgi:integrase